MRKLFLHTPDEVVAAPSVRLADAHWPVPFRQGLEYSPPARGPWTIVHVGYLIPECHEIFVCAAACLRGVVLSAAELGLQRRFSTITVTEEQLRDGELETTMIEGVTHILEQLPSLPPAVLIFSSCLHHFAGADLSWVYRTLAERFPTVVFTDCYMTPTLRKSEMPPDNKMRRQLYHGLKPASAPSGGLLLAGSLETMGQDCEFARAARIAGVPFFEIPATHTYADYQRMAQARAAVTINPAAKQAGQLLASRHGMQVRELLLDYDEARIDQSVAELCALVGIKAWDTAPDKKAAQLALEEARQAIGDRSVAICQTATTRPVALAKRLTENGIRVSDLFVDAFMPAEREDFETLRRLAPDIVVHPTITPVMRFAAPAQKRSDIVAIGQKAAWFTGTVHMVNVLEGGPWWGHIGMRRLAEAIRDAALTQVDVDRIISVKGYGCNGCC
ncbi:MAG: nitrogenase component 1 [Duodenibacillus sp.]